MGYYLRKAIRVGPLRFNLSKSGVGVSAGIRGFRLGSGPRGNYVHMGRGGLYYRKTLPSLSELKPESSQHRPPLENSTQPSMEEIESGPVSQMTDSSAADLLEELNNKHKKWCLWKIVVTIAVIIAFLTSFNVWIIVTGIILTAATHWYDQLRKTTVLFYEFEPEAEEQYQELHNGFDKLKGCNRTWHIEAKGDVDDPKYHAGANMLINRKRIIFSKGSPSYVKTNIEIPFIPAGKQVLYFFPERILVYESGKVGAVSYNDLKLDVSSTRFIEEEAVPSDSQIVDRTWRYTNKSGGPDKRFKDNREIPIVLYERLMFTSESGLREYFDASALNKSEDFCAAIRRMGT